MASTNRVDSGALPTQSPSHILIVEEGVSCAAQLSQYFYQPIERQSLTFHVVADVAEALIFLKDHAIDIILLDIALLTQNGLAVLEKFSRICPSHKAIVLSADPNLKMIRMAMNQGAYDCLVLPLDYQDLETTIRRAQATLIKERSCQLRLQSLQEQLSFNAYHDVLTQLPNRVWFHRALEYSIQKFLRQRNYLYAVLFLDLDRFKEINDNFGHPAGDEFLINVAWRLEQCVRSTDTVARFGGDEFAILLDDIESETKVIQIAHRILEELTKPFELKNFDAVSGGSIGIVLGTVGYHHPDEVLRDADAAMYAAKDQGKGQFVIFDPDVQVSAAERLALEQQLRSAISNQELSLKYQPILSLDQGETIGFEVFCRWNHPQNGWIAPQKFIPVAEESGLISKIGFQVFRECCNQLSCWQKEFPQCSDMTLSVNLSTVQLRQVDFVDELEKILRATGLKGKNLIVEISEHWLQDSLHARTDLLNRLREVGVQICLDDFGTGYSILSRMHLFPVDMIKINRRLIQQLDQDETVLDAIRTIIHLAQMLGRTIVIEGIETRSQLQQLTQLGCEYVQGFLFSRPVDAANAQKFLSEDYPIQVSLS